MRKERWKRLSGKEEGKRQRGERERLWRGIERGQREGDRVGKEEWGAEEKGNPLLYYTTEKKGKKWTGSREGTERGRERDREGRKGYREGRQGVGTTEGAGRGKGEAWQGRKRQREGKTKTGEDEGKGV